jgi:pyruvate formate lyase activating enzyme
MVTNGYIHGNAIKHVYRNMDGANVDLKAFTEKFYNDLTMSHLNPVLDTLKALVQLGVWLEITNLIIPNKNDSDAEITKMCEWIFTELSPFIPLHFTAFHPTYNLTTEPPTTERTLLKARQIALDMGIKYVYVGNVSNQEASSTYCHNCESLLIERNWYATSIVNLNQDECSKCYVKIPGVYS